MRWAICSQICRGYLGNIRRLNAMIDRGKVIDTESGIAP
jgi:hypothetical protein